MSTPHIRAEQEDVSKIVLMPGDPLRAKYIAENFLQDYKLVNDVRNMLAYTGYYKGKKISVFSSGMGMASMGIYSYELYKFYNVDTIIRVGSAGAYKEDINLKDLLLVEGCFSESSFAKTQNGEESHILYSSNNINKIINETAMENNILLTSGIVHSSDVFYKENDNYEELREKYGCLAVEMETFSLFSNAKVLNKNAAALVTISDNLVKHGKLTIEERETSFNEMIKLALETAIKL